MTSSTSSYWNTDPHLNNMNDVTHQQRVTHQSAGYHVMPMRDEFYWERECDEALSLRSEGSLSHCEDFDDVIVNANRYDDSVTSHDVICADTNCVNLSDEAFPQIGVHTNNAIPNDVSLQNDHHQLNVDHLLTESTYKDTSCQDIGDPCNGISHQDIGDICNGISHQDIGDPCNGISHQDIGDPCNGISHTSVHHNRIAQQKAKIAFMTKEVGSHNISKQYFNRLNVVLSVTLVVCCVVGIGLFLLYMLSCDG